MRIKSSERKYHFVYKTTCLVTGRYYVGMHSTDNIKDGYLGSGVRINRSIKKYGAKLHTREILEYLPTREAAGQREKELITEEMRANQECLNCGPGGLGAVDRPATKDETRAKISKSSKRYWTGVVTKLRGDLDDQIARFTMTRAEILQQLIQPDGKLSKNATRALIKLQANKLAGQTASTKMKRRDRLVYAKWDFILSQLQNPKFKPNLVEQIDAYVMERQSRPICKICNGQVTFFRFGQPYATYCGASCQLKDPSQRRLTYAGGTK